MSNLKYSFSEKEFWSSRYQEGRIGWDIGYASTPLKMYIDQLKNKDLKILIPGAGNAYEAEYLYGRGFKNIFVLDISNITSRVLRDSPPFPTYDPSFGCILCN